MLTVVAPRGECVGSSVCVLHGDATAGRQMERGQEVHIFAGDNLDNSFSEFSLGLIHRTFKLIEVFQSTLRRLVSGPLFSVTNFEMYLF